MWSQDMGGTAVILSGSYSKFQASLGYMILHLKNKMKKKKAIVKNILK